MNCLFCGGRERDSPSKEHLISQPVADAFGINRDNVIASIDGWKPGSSDFEVVRMTKISDLSVRLPCRSCNSGWMNDLEQGMSAVARWARAGDNGLSPSAYETLLRWLLKTYIVMTAIEGGIRRFGSSTDFHLIPEATRARLLWEKSERALHGVSFGFARWPVAGSFTYGFGNPTVKPVGPNYANRRSAGALTLNLGTLSACVVAPVFDAQVAIPEPYVRLHEGDRYRRLPKATRLPQVGEIVVENGDHDLDLILGGLTTWADEHDRSGRHQDLG